MKLVLDELHSELLAEQLRARGHDAVGVREAGLEGAGDEHVLAWAREQRRVLLTDNHRDFMRIAAEWARAGRTHHGVLLTAHRSLPRSRSTIGRFIDALEPLLKANPDDDALMDQVRWIS